ncbi:hypothetical protein F5Y13DRAFT_193189 [Hypoxylon sp. FL1857]|nr:hypothetical protein F5Y13DRAFT_193189 [Hypoxylon sp. FL1857]
MDTPGGEKRRRSPSPEPPTDPSDTTSLPERVVLAPQTRVREKFKKNFLIDLEDLHPNEAANIHVSGPSMHGHYKASEVLEVWKAQNGGVIPPTKMTLARLSKASRLAAQSPANIHYRESFEGATDMGYLEPTAAPPPQRPAGEPAKKGKRKRNTRNGPRHPNNSHNPGAGPHNVAAAGGYAATVDADEEDRLEVQDVGRPTGYAAPPSAGHSLAPSRSVCANCGKSDHSLDRCPGPVDGHGFLPGCVIHNTMDHGYDQCPRGSLLTTRQHFFHLVENRAGLPPVRTIRSWPNLATGPNARRLDDVYPLSRVTSLGLSRHAIDNYDFSESAPLNQLENDGQTNSFEAVSRNLDLLNMSERASLESVHGCH